MTIPNDDDHLQSESLKVIGRVLEIVEKAEMNLENTAFRLDDVTYTDQVPENARHHGQDALSDLEAAVELLSDWIDTHGSEAWAEKYGDRFA